MHTLKIKHPYVWATIVFLPMLTITLVGLLGVHIGYILKDTPRVFSNLWSDISSWCNPFCRRETRIFVLAWKDFLKTIKRESEDKNDE